MTLIILLGYETAAYDERKLTDDDYIFRRKGEALPMTPSSFTWRFKLILKSTACRRT